MRNRRMRKKSRRRAVRMQAKMRRNNPSLPKSAEVRATVYCTKWETLEYMYFWYSWKVVSMDLITGSKQLEPTGRG
jgi:hypothetical protein